MDRSWDKTIIETVLFNNHKIQLSNWKIHQMKNNKYSTPNSELVESLSGLFQFDNSLKSMFVDCIEYPWATRINIAQMTKSSNSTYLRWITKSVIPNQMHFCSATLFSNIYFSYYKHYSIICLCPIHLIRIHAVFIKNLWRYL